jgi:SdrD B-like domain
MTQPRAVWRSPRLWLGIASTALTLAVLLPATATASTWADEAAMRNSPPGPARDTFVYDPGVGNEIPRDAFVQAPLAGYYESAGFDANFLTWAPVQQIFVPNARWASCVNHPHTEPCPLPLVHYDPVNGGVASGVITALNWNGAFIAKVCGNFTQGGGAGPIPEITGVKYEDLNANGQRDPGEPGLGGWTMQLLYNGGVVAQTTTAADGSYAFRLDADNLPIGAGTYQVQEVQQPGWFSSQAPGPVNVPLGATNATFAGNDFGNYDPPITAAGTPVSAIEAATFSGQVATFTDPDVSATPGEYAATIEWGDGTSTAGAVSGSGGSFAVSGEHAYADEGAYEVKVAITDRDNSAISATATSLAIVGDAALAASGVNPMPISPQTFGGAVANFTDANTTSTTADFTATIEWGDGSPASEGTVSGEGGAYSVSGSHTYEGTGYFTIKVHIVDDGGSTADATTQVLIYGTAKGGNFVIGDKNATAGTSVTFWGAQWWKLNSLSGGSGPAAFKGFEDSPATAACGSSWTTDPGNSTPPPTGPLPEYMAVIVSSKVSRAGSAISGNTVHEVVVKTNPGYASDPGHAGTGTVIATIC